MKINEIILGTQHVSESSDDDIWGPQGRFAGDTPVNIGGATMKMIQPGDIVHYLGQKAEVEALSKDRKLARIKMSGRTQDVNTSDLKQYGQGVAEGLTQGRNLNPETEKYVQDHKWKLTTVNPMDLDTDAFDDPYNRVIDIDVDHPVNFKDPIIVDANGVIIDGFHRAYQAQRQGLKQLPAYIPVKEVTKR